MQRIILAVAIVAIAATPVRAGGEEHKGRELAHRKHSVQKALKYVERDIKTFAHKDKGVGENAAAAEARSALKAAKEALQQHLQARLAALEAGDLEKDKALDAEGKALHEAAARATSVFELHRRAAGYRHEAARYSPKGHYSKFEGELATARDAVHAACNELATFYTEQAATPPLNLWQGLAPEAQTREDALKLAKDKAAVEFEYVKRTDRYRKEAEKYAAVPELKEAYAAILAGHEEAKALRLQRAEIESALRKAETHCRSAEQTLRKAHKTQHAAKHAAGKAAKAAAHEKQE